MQETPIVIADLTEQKSVDEMVRNTSVIISAAGPFKLLGIPIVDACVRLGTHYCDTTGGPLAKYGDGNILTRKHSWA
jgi:short subunit dehydrogenase-like uncharacterized protein